jgi:hypothetical protein
VRLRVKPLDRATVFKRDVGLDSIDREHAAAQCNSIASDRRNALE